MTDKRDKLAETPPVDDTGRTTLLADEDMFDRRRILWRLTSWGVAAIGAVTVAILSNQSSITLRRDQAATAELARQTQRIRALAQQNHTETSRLASALEALNGDRDRLDARVATLEQGLESVTGSITRQTQDRKSKNLPVASSANTPASTAAAGSLLQAAVTAPTHVAAIQSEAAPGTAVAAPVTAATNVHPDAAQTASVRPSPAPAADAGSKEPKPPAVAASTETSEAKVMASAQPAAADAGPLPSAAPDIPVQRTEFGVDLGSANSIDGLRALWRGVLRAHSAEVGSLEPIIVIQERTNGLGMRLHLVAGPLSDAAAAAKICAALIERRRPCETSVYDGQHLVLREGSKSAGGAQAKQPEPQRVALRHKRSHPPVRVERPLPVPPPPPRP